MAVFSGKDGSLKFEGAAIARVRSWSMQSIIEPLDTTNLGQIAREYTAGLKGATGTASIYYHDDNTTLVGVLNNCLTTGAPASGAMELLFSTKALKFNCLINTVTVTCSTGEVMAAEIGFTMTGDYTALTL